MLCRLTSHFKKGIIGEDFQINIEKLDLIARWVRTFIQSEYVFFSCEERKYRNRYWLDNLPLEIKKSTFLTGNEISKLANVKSIPFDLKKMKITSDPKTYRAVKKMLMENNIKKAWELLYFEST